MSHSPTQTPRQYAPLYFLASVGSGGLVVTFFMYLMFWVKHPAQPVPVFEDIMRALNGGSPWQTAAIVAAYAGIAFFGFLNLKSLFWNIGQYRAFRQTAAYDQLRQTNAETQLLAMPLALAMGINVAFIIGLVFVPQLWLIVEYMFPVAMIAFLIVGAMAFRLIGDFLGRVLTKGGVFDMTAHNSFAQLLPAFALSMVAVGLAAPAAMSTTPQIVALSILLSTFFGIAALVYAVVAAITGFASMLQHGTAQESGPTLMIVIPILTVLAIMVLRQDHGMHTTFDGHSTAIDTLMFLTKVLSIQLVFLGLGLLVLGRQGYGAQYINGPDKSAGSYALICPGVALSVLLHFWINKGLVATGTIAKFGVPYWGLTAIALMAQVAMIVLLLRLNRKHFGSTPAPHSVPAE